MYIDSKKKQLANTKDNVVAIDDSKASVETAPTKAFLLLHQRNLTTTHSPKKLSHHLLPLLLMLMLMMRSSSCDESPKSEVPLLMRSTPKNL